MLENSIYTSALAIRKRLAKIRWRHKEMDFYFLLLSLFFPRVVLLVYFFMERFPANTLPIWINGILGLFVPRVLILIFIYQNMGTDNVWFVVHLAVLVLTCFTGGMRSVRWKRGRREAV